MVVSEQLKLAGKSVGHTRATEREERRWRRALTVGLVVAAILHVAVLFSVRSTVLPPSPFTAAGPNRGDYRAAAGGDGGLTMVDIRNPAVPAEVEVLPVEPVPVPEPEPEPVPEPEVEPATPAPEVPTASVEVSMPGVGDVGTGGESGTATGPGSATGTGEGDGGADESGEAGLIAPRPRGILIPPAGRPASAKGQEITVWVFVTQNGRVVADSTRLDPPTSDGRYNNRLRQTVADWVFEPARRGGQPVAAWYPFEIIL